MTKSHVAHCFKCLELMNTMVLLTMLLVSHDADASVKCKMTEKVMLNLILIILNYQIQWWYWQCNKCQVSSHDQSWCTLFQSSWPRKKMVTFTMPWMSYDTQTDASSITWQKETGNTLFNFLSLVNNMVTLMMQLASQDNDAGTNEIKWVHPIFSTVT